jgi:hypothetical protein
MIDPAALTPEQRMGFLCVLDSGAIDLRTAIRVGFLDGRYLYACPGDCVRAVDRTGLLVLDRLPSAGRPVPRPDRPTAPTKAAS